MNWTRLWKAVREQVDAHNDPAVGMKGLAEVAKGIPESGPKAFWPKVAAADWKKDVATVTGWAEKWWDLLAKDTGADTLYIELGDCPELCEAFTMRLKTEARRRGELSKRMIATVLPEDFFMDFEGREDGEAVKGEPFMAHGKLHHRYDELKTKVAHETEQEEEDARYLLWPMINGFCLRAAAEKANLKKLLGDRPVLHLLLGFEWTCCSWVGSITKVGWKAPAAGLLPKVKVQKPKVEVLAADDVRKGPKKGESDLAYAKRVIKSGVNPNFEPKRSHSPIFCASFERKSRKKLIDQLLANGADIDFPNPYGVTLLLLAILEWDSDLALFALERKADHLLRGDRDMTLLHYIAWNADGFKDTILLRKLLKLGIPVGALDSRKQTPLHHLSSNADFARVLLKAGADPNAVDEEGKTCLMIAGRDPIVATILLGAGAKPNAQDKLGQTALHHMVAGLARVPAPCVEALVTGGASAAILDKQSNNPLHVLDIDDAKAIKALVAAGAIPDAINKEGDTLIHAMANRLRSDNPHRKSRLARAITTLLACGARTDIRNKKGETFDDRVRKSKVLREALEAARKERGGKKGK